MIPNVKHNHVEKTIHPCQFPIELVERLVLALTNERDLVIDPYAGVASALCAAAMHSRRAAGADLSEEYLNVAKRRIELAMQGSLPRRPLGKLVYVPSPNDTITKRPRELGELTNGRHPFDQSDLLFA